METTTKKQVKATDMKGFIDSLKDQSTSLLIIDSKMCKHSKRLLEEINVTSTLKATPAGKSPRVMHILDLADQEGRILDMLTWLPGVPCLLAASKVHLGVDAFAKCREMCRSVEGVNVHDFNLLR